MSDSQYALKPKDPPEGCQEIPGYIVEVVSGVAWLTKDGFVTVKWEERGVWATPEEAQAAGNKSLLLGLPPNKP